MSFTKSSQNKKHSSFRKVMFAFMALSLVLSGIYYYILLETKEAKAAWGVPKISTAVTAASGNITLNEPAGIAQGDLMVACISYRSNAAFTLPTGGAWSLVATQQSLGDTDFSAGVGSGLMAYAVRGASAPNLVFTRTAGDIARGVIVAYTGGNATPYDTGSSLTAAYGTVASTTTFSTAEAGELIVACMGGGDNVTSSAFDAATDPATESGATDTTTAPTNGTWLERYDNGSNGGADEALAIADAIRQTAGATGIMQVTLSGNGRHVMVAGAFKQAPTAPSVTTNAATNVTHATARLNGQIDDAGGGDADQHGFAWGTNANLANGDTATTSLGTKAGTGTFYSDVPSVGTLSCGTTYYFRAYATNVTGTGYGSSILNFSSPCPTGATTIPGAKTKIQGGVRIQGGVKFK